MRSIGHGDSLRTTLRDLLVSRADNAALGRLLDDYAVFHLALVVVGGVFLAIAVVVAVTNVRRCFLDRRSPAPGARLRRRAHLGLGVLGLSTAVFLTLVVAGNVSNVLQPRQGLAGALGLLGSPRPGTRAERLQQAFEAWLDRGDPELPDAVRHAVDARLGWQQPKAIICTALFAVLFGVSILVWRRLLRHSGSERVDGGRAKNWLMVAGVVSVGCTLLLMLMVMGNVQAVIAPVAMTLFYG